MMFPRIHEAFKLHLREFVAHDYCQQVVRKAFYRCSAFRKRSNGLLGMLCCFLLQALMTPVVSLFHSVSRVFDFQNGSRISKLFRPFNLEVPVRRLASHYAMDIFFVILVIITLSNPSDEPGVLDVDSYDVLSLVMVVGLTFSDLEKMIQLSWHVRTEGKTRVQTIWARCAGFFDGWYMTSRFFGHLSYLIGCVVKYIGYMVNPISKSGSVCKGLKGSGMLAVNLIKVITSPRNDMEEEAQGDIFSNATAAADCFDLSNYPGSHSVRVGMALQGIALVIAMIHLLQILRLYHNFSAIFIGLTKCFNTVMSFFIAYFSITLAFSVGIYFVLDQFECLSQNINDQELFGRYGSFNGTLTTLILNVFDPGYPDAIDQCTNGFSRVIGLALWYLYFLIVVIVLVNLLIALMNSVMGSIQRNAVSWWKYSQTLLWMRFCSKGVVLPSPLNLVDLIIRLLLCIWHRNGLTNTVHFWFFTTIR